MRSNSAKIPEKGFGRHENLKSWNIEQKNLWEELYPILGFHRNDTDKFFEFGKFFHDYFESTGMVPEVFDVLDYFRSKRYAV